MDSIGVINSNPLPKPILQSVQKPAAGKSHSWEFWWLCALIIDVNPLSIYTEIVLDEHVYNFKAHCNLFWTNLTTWKTIKRFFNQLGILYKLVFVKYLNS